MRYFRQLSLCLLAFAQAASAAPQLQWLSSLTWTEQNPAHGGYSGLHVSADGAGFIAITDRGDIATGQMERNEADQLQKIGAVQISYLRPVQPSGTARPSAHNSNAEGLAVAADGTLYVSFEGHHRVRRYKSPTAPARYVKSHPDFQKFQSNSGLEAIAIDSKNYLYTLPERSGKWTRPFPVYRKAGPSWTKWASLPRRDRFLPTGADIGPDGRLYLLERRFEMLQGFATRVRRFEISEQGLTGEVTLLDSGFFAYGNTEGISVWQAKDGSLRITLLTDDNFNFLQRTQFHEFRLEEAP